MFIIGVTGGVGSGKSELLRYIKKKYNCRILMSDEASHEVMKPGGQAYRELVELLRQYPADEGMRESQASEHAIDPGKQAEYGAVNDCGQRKLRETSGDDNNLLEPDGTIRHSEMAARIFAHKDLLEKVNGILHPAVRTFIMEAIAEEKRRSELKAPDAVDYFFLEAALLIEGGYKAVVDEMWYIYCNPEERIRRLKSARGYTDEKIAGIMAAQLSEEEFRAGSDVVIDNSGGLADAYRQIDRAIEKIQEKSR